MLESAEAGRGYGGRGQRWQRQWRPGARGDGSRAVEGAAVMGVLW